MKRRILAAVAAVLIAAVGSVLLLTYVLGADQRAMADLQPTAVVVVTKAVPEGADSKALAEAVAVHRLPATAVAPGAATRLDQLSGLVTTTALQPGEQLLLSRLADPAVLEAAKGFVVPKGLHKVSVQLEPQRVVGGKVATGDRVAVFYSSKEATVLALDKALVVSVDGGAPAGDGEAAEASASGPLTVTLGLTAADAQKVVFAVEHGSIWLSYEPADAPTGAPPVLQEKDLLS